MSVKNGFEAWLQRQLHSLKSAFTGALLVLGVVGLLEHNGHLELADVLMYRVMAVQQPNHRRDFSDLIAPLPESTQSPPLALGITRESFEKDFSERSPLDREKLSALIKPLLDAKPAVLAIDLDLSPLRSANPAEQRAQKKLDDMLLRAAGRGTQVVLLAPFAASDKDFREQKFKWLTQICKPIASSPEAGRIWVALSDLVEQSGTLAKFDRQGKTLGILAQQAYRPRDAFIERLGAGDLCADIYPYNDINKAVFLFDFAASDMLHSGDEKGLRPIRFDYFATPATYNVSLANFDEKKAKNQDALSARLKERLVFLGGLYNSGDWFVTPAGRVAGVEVHAAIANTLRYQDSYVGEHKKFVIDVILGMLFGLIFSSAWKHYHDGVRDGSYARQVSSVVLGMLALVAGFGVVVLLLYVALRLGYWFNALPMLIGMTIHSLHHVVYTPHDPLPQQPIHSRAGFASTFAAWVTSLGHGVSHAWKEARTSRDGKFRFGVKLLQLGFMTVGLTYLVRGH